MAPPEEGTVTKLKQLLEQVPHLGKKKILSKLNSDDGWDIPSKYFRVNISSIEDDWKRAAGNARQQASQDQDEDPASSIGMLTGVMQATNIEEVDYANSKAYSEVEVLQQWVVNAESCMIYPPKFPNDS